MVNEITKTLPVDYLDIKGVQDWLEQMAREGYFLDDTTGWWWHFNGGDPKEVRYRIDPNLKKKKKIEPEKKEDYETMGWHYVLTYREYHIFMAEDRDTEELHTDCRVESMALKKLEKSLKMDLISFLILLILPYFISHTSRTELVAAIKYPLAFWTSGSVSIAFAYFLLIGYLIKTGISLKQMRVLRRALDEGRTARAGKNSKNAKRFRKIGRILSIGMFGAYFFMAFSSCQSVDGPEYVKNPGEILMLENLESGKIIPNPEERHKNNDWWIDSQWTLLLKKKYEIHQRCMIEGRTENGELVPVVLNAEYYRFRIPGMAASLYQELSEKHISTVLNSEVKVLAAGTYLDACTIGRVEGMQILIGQKGDVVLHVEYNGDESIEENAEKIGELMLEVPQVNP